MRQHEGASTGERITDLIVRDLVGRIQAGDMAVGDALPTERELCDRFDASRPTVREALSRVSMMGYARTETGRRPRVTKPSLDDVLLVARDHALQIVGEMQGAAHLEQMRLYIEGGAIREVAMRATNLQIATIKTALDENFAAIGTPRFPQSDVVFHRAIVAVSANPIMLALHDMFVGEIIAHRPPHADARRHDEMVYGEHLTIYEAVLDQDESRALHCIDRHLTRSYRSRLKSPNAVDRSAESDRETDRGAAGQGGT